MADRGDLVRQSQDRHHDRGANDADEHAGDPRREPLRHQDHRHGPESDHRCGEVRLIQPEQEILQLGRESLRVDREAQEVRQLPDDDRCRDTGEVTDPHRLRDQIGEEPETRDTADD